MTLTKQQLESLDEIARNAPRYMTFATPQGKEHLVDNMLVHYDAVQRYLWTRPVGSRNG